MRKKEFQLKTKRLGIREFEQDDAADLFEIFGAVQTMRNVEPSYDRRKTEAFLRPFCIG